MELASQSHSRHKTVHIAERMDTQIHPFRGKLKPSIQRCAGLLLPFGKRNAIFEGRLANFFSFVAAAALFGFLLLAPLASRAQSVTVSPTGNIITDTPDFVFPQNTNPGVTWYRLRVLAAGGAGQVLHQGWYDTASICQAGTCAVNPGVRLAQVVGSRDLVWDVSAYNAATQVTALYLGPFDFTVLAPTVTATTINPDGRPAFTFDAPLDDVGNTPDHYRFLVVKAAGGQAYDVWLPESAGTCSSGACSFKPPGLLYNGGYTLYLSAYRSSSPSGFSAWSLPFAFTVSVPPPDADFIVLNNVFHDFDPDTLTGINPCSGAPLACQTDTPVFQFSPDTGANYSGDWLQFRLLEDSTGSVVYETWLNWVVDEQQCGVPESASTPSCFVRAPNRLTNGRGYTWQVRSWGPGGASVGGSSGYTTPGGPSDPNGVARFTVALPGSGVTGLTTQIVNSEVFFRWDHEPTATWYQLRVIDSSTGNAIHDKWYQSQPEFTSYGALWCSTICELVPASFTNGEYTWTVRYWNGAVSAWNTSPAALTLNVVSPTAPTTDVMTVSNAEIITGRTRLYFQWPRDPKATWYQLEVWSADDGALLHTQWYRALIDCSADCMVYPQLHLAAGFYWWRVRAWGPGGISDWSAGATFRLNAVATGQVTPLSPINNAILENSTHNIQFRWQVGSNTSWYQLTVVNIGTGEVVHNKWYHQDQTACRTSTTCTLNLSLPLPNGYYKWDMRAYGPAGIGEWVTAPGSPAAFVLNRPPTDPATLLAPLNGAVVLRDVTFEWEHQSNATWYGLGVTASNGVAVIAGWHTAEAVCDPSANRCALNLPDADLPPGSYRWHIKSWGVSNGSLTPQSETWTFTKS